VCCSDILLRVDSIKETRGCRVCRLYSRAAMPWGDELDLVSHVDVYPAARVGCQFQIHALDSPW
jgi:hypothetical protein